MGIFTAVRDFSRKKKLAATILHVLDQRRPGGVDIARYSDPEGVAALMHLIGTRRDLTVVKNKKQATLMYREDVDASFSPEIARSMNRGHLLAYPNEDLFPHEGEDAQEGA